MYLNSMLAREVRNLIQIQDALDNGQPTAAVFKKFRIWDKRKNVVSRCLKERSKADFMQCLKLSAGVDSAVKGMRQADPWIELEKGYLALAGVA